MRHATLCALALSLAGLAVSPATAEEACDTAAFRAAVAQTSAALTEMNAQQSRHVRAHLAGVRAMEGWSDADLAGKAAALVTDAETARLDAASKAAMARVALLDASGSEACGALASLRAALDEVSALTRSKWAHIAAKIARRLEPAAPAAIHAGN